MKKYLIFLMMIVLIGSSTIIANGAEITLSIGHSQQEEHPYQIAAETFREIVERESNGELKVKIYPGEVLGDETTMLENLRVGALELVVGSHANFAPMVETFNLFSIAYLFEGGIEQALNCFDDPRFLNELKTTVKNQVDNVMLLGVGTFGTREMYNRIKPVKSLEDIQDFKMRVMANPTESKVWSALGTSPTNIAFGEIYTALESGVVDAGENSLGAIVSSHFPEVAPYVAMTHHQVGISPLLMSESVYNNLSEEHQEIIQEAGKKAMDEQVQYALELTDRLVKQLEDDPDVTLTRPDPAEFAAQTKPIIEETVKEVGAEALYEIIQENNPEN